ncbi:VOC family protein [Nocardiopsis ansamitocini]|uniref:VOC family protein n=1 Tax=Nocardiopsis ansamitocini TaxID=1670832 RepID=UPI002553C736|nr:VOC family protein [Nocardiopsis ansamitocini]
MHHIAIQTTDLANCTSWYQDFFGCRATWSTDEFSELTRERLPGITRMAEVVVGATRFHLFERISPAPHGAGANATEFQHLCMAVESPAALDAWRRKWTELHRSGRYAFLRADPPSETVVDKDGVESFYCLDVNGLEFEFTYVPAGPR